MPFELQPILKGELLELRPLRVEDFPDLYAVAADPLIWEQHPDKDRYQEAVFKEFFRGALESGGAFSAIDPKNGKIIGSSRFHDYDEERNEVEIGWTFLSSMSRTGERLYKILINLLRLPYEPASNISLLKICRRSFAYTTRRNAGEPTFLRAFREHGAYREE